MFLCMSFVCTFVLMATHSRGHQARTEKTVSCGIKLPYIHRIGHLELLIRKSTCGNKYLNEIHTGKKKSPFTLAHSEGSIYSWASVLPVFLLVSDGLFSQMSGNCCTLAISLLRPSE